MRLVSEVGRLIVTIPGQAILEDMELAPEVIVFGTLFSIGIVWTLLKLLVNRVIDFEAPTPPAVAQRQSHRLPSEKAA
jgi:hypothetical protein